MAGATAGRLEPFDLEVEWYTCSVRVELYFEANEIKAESGFQCS